MAVVYALLLLVSSGVTAVFARYATSEVGARTTGWSVIATVMALAAGVGLVRVPHRR